MTNEYYGAHTDLVPGTKARSGDINAMDQAIVEAFDKVPSAKALKSGNINYVVDQSITPNTYAVTMDAMVTAYVDGLEVKMKPASSNTGTATLNVNGIGNVTIGRQDGTPLLAGDILAQGPLTLTYNATTNAFHIPPTGNAHVSAAAASATAAANSASSAGTSASTASTASSTAVTKAGEAATSATTATTAATTATTKAGEAATSAGSAAGSASAAATSASSASTSAQNLATSLSIASNAATTATTKAGEAATSASSAATSAANLSTAVSAAQAAQSLAQQWAAGSGIIGNGQYSAQYYASQAASSAAAVSTGQVNADWNATSGAAQILNKPSVTTAANFAVGSANSILANFTSLRTVSNPSTDLNYASGVRFRLAYLNDIDSSGGYADVMDLSTYTDSTAGGYNALYFDKGGQRIMHKFGAAGATAWTAKQLAYMDSNITGTSAGAPWSGISSKPTTIAGYGITDAQAKSTDLAALAALATTGILVRTGSGSMAARQLSGSGGIAVTNSDGIAGNPTIALGATGVSAGSYGSGSSVTTFTVDAQGRMSAASAVMVTPQWANILTKPTTLAGYGITDAYSSSNPSGFIGANSVDTLTNKTLTSPTLNTPLLNKPTFKGYIEQLQVLNPGATVTLNPDNGTLIELTTTVSSTAITLPAAVPGASFTLAIRWGATGHTATFAVAGGGTLRWTNGNTIPTATSIASKIDAYIFTCITGMTIGRDGWRNA